MEKMIPVLVAAMALFVSRTNGSETPQGWFRAGSHPKEYEMTVDRTVSHGGKTSASLKCVAPQSGGFGTLMQTFKADTFRGKRVRMSGYVRAHDVSGWTGLWMRVDGSKNEVLAFDNMQDRAIKGTCDWEQYEIVLDVPEQAEQISFGLLLAGKGQAWMDDLKYEGVGKDVPTTGGELQQRELGAPKNLDFED